ncbi:MAG: GntR family transcriptional regulator [Acidimicrobiales bacterium]
MAVPAGPGLRPVERPAPLRLQVYEALAELIATGTLEPGQHLVEAELAGRLRVSRQPVREAIEQLRSDGWVDRRPGQGAFVHQPTHTEIDQVFAVRTLLEPEAARLAAARLRPEDAAVLVQLCADGMAAHRAEDFPAVVAANTNFHRRITELAGTQVLTELIARLERRVRWSFLLLGRAREAHGAEHAAIVEALASRDSESAAAGMRAHIEATRQGYRQSLSAWFGDSAQTP